MFSQAHALLHGHEQEAFGDASYIGIDKRDEMKSKSVKWHVAAKRGKHEGDAGRCAEGSDDRAKPAALDSWGKFVMRMRNVRIKAHPRGKLLRMGGAPLRYSAIPRPSPTTLRDRLLISVSPDG